MNDIFRDLFIFEMANNHQGSLMHGVKIIESMAKIAKKYKVNAAMKFQYRDIDTFIHPDYKGKKDIKHVSRFESTRLKDSEFLKLVEAVREYKMNLIVTPFDEISVHKCVKHGVDIIKIGSCSANDWPLLETVASVNKPVIISTGGLALKDIDKVATFFSHNNVDFALMHCVSLYPMSNETANLNVIDKLKLRYPGIPIGYSGHESPDNIDIVKIAKAKGAEIIERHVGIETDSIQLNKYSMNPKQVENWMSAALLAQEICGGSGEKLISDEERTALSSLKRGVFATREIAQGQIIKREDVFFAIPCQGHQTESQEFGSYRVQVYASRNYKPNDPIVDHPETNKITQLREIVHEAKGMINEANIVMGNDIQIELSHHYGFENLRRIGAVIVNVVNRNYCKKLIIMLPGQDHPKHRHKQKEETFQLLWGDIDVNVDGKRISMHPGDKVLVEPHVWHSFTTQSGAICEEISTTHYRNDSEYEDPEINKLDPMQRKTILEEW